MLKLALQKLGGLRANYLPFQLTAEELLEQIQLNRGYVESAYEHAKTKFELELRIKEMTNEEGLVILEMYHDLDRQELLRQKEEERRKAEIDASEFRSNVFGLGLILFLLLTSILFRQYYLTRKEKNRSESLLLNILPGDTAQELKQNGITTARLHKDVTVLFCDIVKFTEVSKLLSPSELVAELDIYFTAFDNIVIENGLEKIKTIGDAYMAVGGVLHGKASTAQDVVNTAFQVLSKVAILREERYSKGKPSFEFRVGIHTGDVIAGVVGSRKFQYDMWGETVNLAARMEQNSLPGKVTISQATYDLIKDDYECESRGKVEAKNIGAISMYFVNRRRV